MTPHNAKPQILLIAPDKQRSTLAACYSGHSHNLSYSPYGLLPLPTPLTPTSKYNGEIFDSWCDGYLLGSGHRVYSPALMRFYSGDQLSPFGKGGLNCYTYCNNDPINYSDPTGQSKFQRSRPGLFQRTLEWANRQTHRIGDSIHRSIDRVMGRREFPELQVDIDASQQSTEPAPDYSALPLKGQKTIRHPFETSVLTSLEAIEKSKSTLETLKAKHIVLEDRLNDPDRLVHREQDSTNMINNELRMIRINSSITLSEGAKNNETIRNSQ